MSWQIVWTRPAVRDLTKRLDRQTADRVRLKMKRFAEAGIGDVERLRGEKSEWRLRVGDWRVRFTYDPKRQTLVVLRVLPRSRAYR